MGNSGDAVSETGREYLNEGCARLTMFQCHPEETFSSIWGLGLEFVRIFFIVKLLFWFMQGASSLRRRSPRIKPRDQEYDLLLRKRLNALNWNLLASKARALYYMKCAYFQRRLKEFENKEHGI
jgi:hypothetical protein